MFAIRAGRLFDGTGDDAALSQNKPSNLITPFRAVFM
jgi:hypothetical protein